MNPKRNRLRMRILNIIIASNLSFLFFCLLFFCLKQVIYRKWFAFYSIQCNSNLLLMKSKCEWVRERKKSCSKKYTRKKIFDGINWKALFLYSTLWHSNWAILENISTLCKFCSKNSRGVDWNINKMKTEIETLKANI